MSKVFNYDNPVFQFLNKVVDCLILSALWIAFSLPVITIGASTTALYYAVNKVICNNRGTIWKSFWSSFRANFKQATIVWLMELVVLGIYGVECYYILVYYLAGIVPLFILVLLFVLGMFLLMWSLYLFPYIARFANSTKSVIINSGYMLIRHFFRSIALLLLFVAAVILFLYWPAGLCIIPVSYMWMSQRILENVFCQYMTTED